MRYQDNSQPQFNTTQDSSATKSFRFARPNYTQTPNDYYDHVMPSLKTVGEHAVMQVVIRQTIGWGNKEWDRISLSQLMKKTGLARSTIRRAIKRLCDRELIIIHAEGRNGEQETFFKLNIEDPDFVSENHSFSNKLDRERFDQGRGSDLIPTKETTTKETKNKVVKVIEQKSKAPPPPISSKVKEKHKAPEITEQQKAELQKMLGEKEANKRIANAIKTLTNPRFENSEYRKMSVYDLALLYHKLSQEEKQTTKSSQKAEAKKWISDFLYVNPHIKEFELLNDSVIFRHGGQGIEPSVLYSDSSFKTIVKEILSSRGIPHKELGEDSGGR